MSFVALKYKGSRASVSVSLESELPKVYVNDFSFNNQRSCVALKSSLSYRYVMCYFGHHNELCGAEKFSWLVVPA